MQSTQHTFRPLTALATFALLCSSLSASATVSIQWVPVRDKGNAADPRTGFGQINVDYAIGKYNVLNHQYVEFLNAKDPTGANALGLYNIDMTGNASGGILRNLANPAGSRYSVKGNQGNNPVVYVNFYDTLRFANWMNNGQGNGDTETGAYTLLGGGVYPTNTNVTRNSNAQVWVVSENEWYKAAFYKAGGPSAGYWDYPTRSNALPASTMPPGGTNSASWNDRTGSGFAVTGKTGNKENDVNYNVNAGAYPNTFSAYDVYDMAGGVWEWNDTILPNGWRGIRGGSWDSFAYDMDFSYRSTSFPSTDEWADLGFRLVSVPEPASLALPLAGLPLLRRSRRAKQ